MQQKGFAKVALVFTAVSSLCMVIGLATPYWYTSSSHDVHAGIWDKQLEGWIQSVRVCVILSFICSLFCLLLLILYIRRDDGQPNLTRISTTSVVAIIAFCLCMAAIIVYAAKMHETLQDFRVGWSYILTTLSGAVLVLILLPLALEVRQSRTLGTYESI